MEIAPAAAKRGPATRNTKVVLPVEPPPAVAATDCTSPVLVADMLGCNSELLVLAVLGTTGCNLKLVDLRLSKVQRVRLAKTDGKLARSTACHITGPPATASRASLTEVLQEV